MSNPKISVIIPVYKVEEYLSRCVESVIHQTIEDLQIILVDDGSPDKCPLICDEYASKDDRIQVVHKKNGGLSSARNAGLKVANGDYVFFLDSDDWLDLDGLNLLYETAEKYKVDFVRYRAIRSGWPGMEPDTPCMLEEAREIAGGNYDKEKIIKEIYPKLFVSEQLTMGPIVGAWGSLYNRKFLTDNDLFFYEEVKFSEDMIFSANVVLKSNSFFYIDTASVYHYFFNPNSISKSFRKERWESCKYLIELFYRDFENIQEYDFKPQLERLKWYCILLGLSERYHIDDKRIKKEYCQMICNDSVVKSTALDLSLFKIPLKQKMFLYSIKNKYLNFLIWR